MKRCILSTLVMVLLLQITTTAQETNYIQEHAVKIDNLSRLSDNIYDAMHPFKLIMVGEMHGTNEPAAFVASLAALLASHGDSVCIGLEIPADQMEAFTSKPTRDNVKRSSFFKTLSVDGRASDAWAAIIESAVSNSRISIFFFDITTSDQKNSYDRDSMMFVNVKRQMTTHPNHTFITLSGNVHSMTQQFRGSPKMGYYLATDESLGLYNRVCSVSNNYSSGTMLNNSGHGLELKTVNMNDTPYSTSVNYNNYLMLIPTNPSKACSAILFTRTISAATMTGQK